MTDWNGNCCDVSSQIQTEWPESHGHTLPATPTAFLQWAHVRQQHTEARHTLTTAKLASTSHSTVSLQAECAQFSGEKTRLQTSPWPAPYRHTPRFPAAHGDQRPCTPGTQGCPDFLFPTQMEECRGKRAENHKALCNLKVALLSLSKNRAQKISNLRQDSLNRE